MGDPIAAVQNRSSHGRLCTRFDQSLSFIPSISNTNAQDDRLQISSILSRIRYVLIVTSEPIISRRRCESFTTRMMVMTTVQDHKYTQERP